MTSRKLYGVCYSISVLAVLILTTLCSFLNAQEYQSEPVTAGYRDFNFGSTVIGTPTAEKPESKLWWNDGNWWGCLWDPTTNKYRIHRFDRGTQNWTNWGTEIDNRPMSLSDVLWDGQRLYIVSHIRSGDSGPARLYRYGYTIATKTYTLDTGFPVDVNQEKSETLTLDKDSTGQLWVTWEKNGSIWINRTLGNDLTWGEPFVIPVLGSAVISDDISAVIAFGDRIGVMWSNQNDQKMYFAVHLDNKADMDWEPREDALADATLGQVADDHINLKVKSDATGNIYAVTKTGLSGSEDPLIYLLKRDFSGQWTRSVFGRKTDRHTRPILLIDEENNKVYIFAKSDKETPGTIRMKSADLDNPVFPLGVGQPFIMSSTDTDINDPTSTKQNLNSTTGLLVLASDEMSRNYMHNYVDLDGSGTNTSPVAVASASPESGEPPLIVSFSSAGSNDADGSIVNYAWDFGDGNGSAEENPSHTYSTSGQFVATLTVTDDQGASNSDAITITVDGEAPSIPQNLVATTISSGQIDITWQSSTDNVGVAGYNIYRDNSFLITVSTTIFSDVALDPLTEYCYAVTAIDVAELESPPSNIACATTPEPEPVENVANGEISVKGTRIGSFVDTQAGDNVYETIREVEGRGKKSLRTSELEHKWTVNVIGGTAVTFYLRAFKTPSSDGDDFDFAYSTDDIIYNDMLTVTKTSDDGGYDTFILPASLSGTVYIRVVDTDRSQGNRALDEILVDHLFIRSEIGGESDTEPPSVPSSVSAAAVSASQIDVSWTQSVDNIGVAGYNIYRDAAFLTSTTTANYSDVSLSSATVYCYAVSAFDAAGNESSQSAQACATTQEGSGAPTMSVADITIRYAQAGPWHKYTPVVLILDQHANPVSNATVMGEWSGALSDSMTSTTDGDGFALFSERKTRSTASVTFCVTNVTHGSLTYEPPQNMEPCATAQVGSSSLAAAFKIGSEGIPTVYGLFQNYPNPFNPEAEIRFQVPKASHVILKVYNLIGQDVRTLIDHNYSAGSHSVRWDGRDNQGRAVASGVYLYRMQAGGFTEVKKMNLLR